jgi:RNA polymerase sigma factor (sigma-70 family)
MYKSFCRRQARGDFDLSGRDALWALLVQITINKARNAANHHRREKRDVGRELGAGSSDAPLSQWELEQLDARTPTAEEAEVLSEALEKRLATLHEPDLREVAMLKLEGWKNREIAEKMGCVDRTIQRWLDLIRERWADSA